MLWLRAFLGIFYGSKPSLTIAPAFWENHWKTINVNGQSGKKTFNGDGPVVVKPLKNHRRQWCSVKKHYHPIVWEKWPSLKSTAVQCSSTRPANSHDGVLSAAAIWWREMAPWFDPDYHRNADESNDIISTMRLCWISRQHGGEIIKVLWKSTNWDWNQAWIKICKKVFF